MLTCLHCAGPSRAASVSIESSRTPSPPPAARALLRDQLRADRRDATCILVRVDGDGATGWGECVADAQPFYSSETVGHGVAHPQRLPGAGACWAGDFAHPREINGARWARCAATAWPRRRSRWRAWDLAAQQAGVPLARLLGRHAAAIASGVSIGIQAFARRAGRARRDRARGRLPAREDQDQARVGRRRRSAFVRQRFGDLPLMVDANAAYTLDDAPTACSALDGFGLMMIEQPLDVRRHPGPRGAAARAAHAGLPGRVDRLGATCRGGHRPEGLPHHQHQAGARRRVRRVDRAARSLRGAAASPCGTAACSRRASGGPHNIHLASLPNFSLPGDIAASRRYYDPDLIDRRSRWPRRHDPVPTGPGIGVDDRSRSASPRTRRTSLRLHA